MSSFRTTETIRIFVVEDDPMYLRLVKYVAETDPAHEVHTFTTGRECLEKLHLEPQIFSLDYSLPDFDGGELMRRIKKVLPDAGFLILSGQQDFERAIGLLREGAHDYIPKDSGTRDRLGNSLQSLKMRLRLNAEMIHQTND